MSRYVYWLFLFLAGCAADPLRDASNPPGIQMLRAGVEYLGPDRESLPASHFPAAITLVFPYMPGEIFGSPRREVLFAIELARDQSFDWPLAQGVERMARHARPLSRHWQEVGLSVQPAETRLARIGTFVFDAASHQSLGGGGFIDPASRDNLILLYVDRGCRIVGDFELEGVRYRHDIDLPGPGFHWLRVSVEGAQRVLRAHPSDTKVRFSVHLDRMLRI